jgi:hypothetical protein
MGIGLVTAIVANIMALALALHIRRHPAYDAYPLRHGLLRLNRPYLKELWRLGLPIGGTYAVEVGLFAFAALCMGTMGSTPLGAHQIALQIVSVAFMVPAGISYAITTAPGNCPMHDWLAGSASLSVLRRCCVLRWCSGCCRTSWWGCFLTTTTRRFATSSTWR